MILRLTVIWPPVDVRVAVWFAETPPHTLNPDIILYCLKHKQKRTFQFSILKYDFWEIINRVLLLWYALILAE